LRGWKVVEVWDKDLIKRQQATAAGYKVITFWEGETNKMSDYDIIELLKDGVLND
jgi:G:T-mismatch repair DNA endonuclease (very short patch repair protein)